MDKNSKKFKETLDLIDLTLALTLTLQYYGIGYKGIGSVADRVKAFIYNDHNRMI